MNTYHHFATVLTQLFGGRYRRPPHGERLYAPIRRTHWESADGHRLCLSATIANRTAI